MVLRGYSSDQEQIAVQVKLQKNWFLMLVADIEKNNMKAGLKYDDVVRRYGAPVLVWNMEAPSLAAKKLLYRNPVEYFSTGRVYLYFDGADGLVKWEYCPVLKETKEGSDVKKSN